MKKISFTKQMWKIVLKQAVLYTEDGELNIHLPKTVQKTLLRQVVLNKNGYYNIEKYPINKQIQSFWHYGYIKTDLCRPWIIWENIPSKWLTIETDLFDSFYKRSFDLTRLNKKLFVYVMHSLYNKTNKSIITTLNHRQYTTRKLFTLNSFKTTEMYRNNNSGNKIFLLYYSPLGCKETPLRIRKQSLDEDIQYSNCCGLMGQDDYMEVLGLYIVNESKHNQLKKRYPKINWEKIIICGESLFCCSYACNDEDLYCGDTE